MTQAGRAILIFLLVIAASGCLILGLTLPAVQFTRLYFWSDTHSLTSIITALYKSGEVFLAAVIFIFSVVFPFFKLVYLAAAGLVVSRPGMANTKILSRMAWLGKWSMLDVLVLALIVFYAKSAALADASALPGIYFFAASVLLTMIAYGLVGRGTP
jgi:paraquat-inducible protein A